MLKIAKTVFAFRPLFKMTFAHLLTYLACSLICSTSSVNVFVRPWFMCQSQQDSDHSGVEQKEGNIGEGKGDDDEEERWG